ncbi:hypothetical protein [Chitinimonas sp.]|uniref:hypothetical protein n=1 Tax=Chitinimonas sp. TaxID=1934313 RepID=UPI0035B0CC59
MTTRNHTNHRIGASHPRAKLTDQQVAEIRRLHNSAAGVGYQTLAKRFGCGTSTVRDICTYRTRWAA